MKDGGARVRLDAISKRFGATVAVDSVSLTEQGQELARLDGPSGCGKTTTLRMVAGLEEPTGGRVLIDDEDVTDQPPHARDITMVFQSYTLVPHLTVLVVRPEAVQIRPAALSPPRAGALGGQVGRRPTSTPLRSTRSTPRSAPWQ